MKKALIIAALSASLSTQVALSETPNDQEQQSRLYLGVYDVSSKLPVLLDKLEISRSSKKQQLCWQINGSFGKIFTSPAKANFYISSDIGMVTSSEDKKTHTITSQRDSLNDGKLVINCWSFDQKDPRGKYTIFIKLGEIEYGPLAFTVVK